MKSKNKLFSLFISTLSLIVLLPVFAQAQQIEKLGQFTDWSAYRYSHNGKPACFMASQPKKAEGNYTRRGQIHYLVSHRTADEVRDENSFVAGYTFREGSRVSVSIGSKAFTLFTKGDTAWGRNEDDRSLTEEMIKGSSMIIKGTSSRGTETTDTFSLSGFTAAYRAMSAACGLEP
jgi:hypothetical protein